MMAPRLAQSQRIRLYDMIQLSLLPDQDIADIVSCMYIIVNYFVSIVS